MIEVVTTINAGGWVQAEAKTKDLLGTATNVNAQGDINLLADKGNASVVAGQNISWSHSTSGSSILWGLIGSSHSSTDGATTVAPSLISAKGNEHVTVQGDFLLKGSALTAGGSIFVTAQNIDLIAMQNTTYHSQMDEKWGIFAAAGAGNGTASVTLAWQDSKTTTSDVQTSSQGASLEAGGNLTINAGGTLNVTGSTATAAGDVNIHAAQVNLAAAQDTDVKQTTTTTDSYGILPAMNNGIGIGIGANLVTDKNGSTTVSSIGALIGSTGGSVFINAGTSVNAQGSIVELLAGNVTVTAPTIEMAAGVDTSTSYAYHSATFIGINISVHRGREQPAGPGPDGRDLPQRGGQDQGPAGQAPLRGGGGHTGGAGRAQRLQGDERAGRAHRGDEQLRHQVRRGHVGQHPGIGRDRPAGVGRADPGGGQSGPLRDGGRPDAHGRQCQRLQCDAFGPARPRHPEPRADGHKLFQEFELVGLRGAGRECELRRGRLQREVGHQRQRLGHHHAKRVRSR